MFKKGDVFVYSLGGGGGYGDVLEREPAAVLQDVREKVITADLATNVYGVVITADAGAVDVEKTAAKRAALRRERLAEAVPFGEFVEQWSKKRPKPEILEHYGDYPEPRVEGYDKPFWGDYK